MPVSLVRKLEQFAPLSDTEKQIVQEAPMRVRHVEPQHDIVSEGDRPVEISLITDGFACRYKILDDGRRQIISFLIPGDICDLRALLFRQMDHSVAALNGCQIAIISHQRLFDIIEKYPRLALAFWSDSMRNAAIYREAIVNLGRRSAYARIAHLLCEQWIRLEVIGMTRDGTFELPITQTDLADATGLSLVHVNRTLQKIRADGLITFRHNLVTVLDPQRLQAVAQFNPTYLAAAPHTVAATHPEFLRDVG